MIKSLVFGFRQFLESPKKVFISFSILSILTLVVNGTFWRLWSLHIDRERKEREIQLVKKEISGLETQLRQAKDSSYIERLAKDRLDFAEENDLVFVFPAE